MIKEIKIVENKIFKICFYIWLSYLLFTIILSFYDINNLKKIQWKQAENVSSTYNGYKASIVTKAYKKDSVKIQRKYGYFSQGLSVWLWGIDKKSNKVDISFFIKEKDYEKIQRNLIPYQRDIFGNILKRKEPIPFFGLRSINQIPNSILLFLDICKYNYIIYSVFIVFFFPFIIIYLCKKFKIKLIVDQKADAKDMSWKYPVYFIFFTIFFYSLI